MNITLNINEKLGKLKPIHGMCNGPLSFGVRDMSDAYREIGVPFVRLHDTNGTYSQVVDIFQSFRDFDADPTDPANYDFLLTDPYITAIHNIGAQTIYRLGTSIEHAVNKRWVHPPKDNYKFAVVCEHIIRHYNEGWANGFNYGIKHWEIWNEPEDSNGKRTTMWTGTKEQYFELYNMTSKHLKSVFKDEIFVGGYASCGFTNLYYTKVILKDDKSEPHYYVQYFHDFLKFIKKNNCPLDFFSFHYYTQEPKEILYGAQYAAQHLKNIGYTDTKLILDEWNFHFKAAEWFTSMRSARLIAATLAAISDSPIDIATYYDGQPHMGHCGIFNKYCSKQKPFYVFKLYNMLYRLGTRIGVTSDSNAVLLAATNKNTTGLLIVGSDSEEDITIVGLSGSSVTALLLDEEHELEKLPVKNENDTINIHIPAGAIMYIESLNDLAN